MGQKTNRIFEQAKAHLKENNHANALRLFNEVLNREPTHRAALRNKCLLKISGENKENAEEFLCVAIEQQPEDDELHQIMGTFYYNHEKPAKALTHFEKAIELNPKNGLAHYGLGMLLAECYADHEKAVRHFSRAIEIEPSADTLFSRGCSYMILQRMSKAKHDFQKAEEAGHPSAGEMIDKYFF